MSGDDQSFTGTCPSCGQPYLRGDLDAADNRAAAATVRLIQRDGAIQRIVDQMLKVEREGTPEAAVHARRWLAVIEAEVRR